MKRARKLGGILCSACRVVLARPLEVDSSELEQEEGACWCVVHGPKGRPTRALLSHDGRLLGVTEILT